MSDLIDAETPSLRVVGERAVYIYIYIHTYIYTYMYMKYERKKKKEKSIKIIQYQ